MLAATDRLAGSLDAAVGSAERMAGAFDGAAAEAADRFAAAEEAAEVRADLLITAVDRLGEQLDTVVASIDATTAAVDDLALSYAAAGDASVVAGDEAETSGGKAATTGAMWKTALLGIAIAAVYGIDKAAGFQSSMEQLHTQAGVAQGKIAGLSQQVLQLAAQVGEGPDSLSESLYHVASNMASLGASGPKMLSAVKIAAEGAQVGGADLVDVTNALTAAIASGIPGVSNFSQAMGMLNATVGSGDMHMQDLADAFSTGLLAVVKGYGLSLKDVGAALATFGDNNIRGAKAGTDLRMSVQALAVPVATAKTQLAALGLTQTSLAADMQSGGLMKALDDLSTRFKRAGITAKDQGEVITTLFGKKAGSGIAVLLEQMDRLRSKYPAIQAAADNFAGDWQARQKTMSQQWDDLKAGAGALAISFGTLLLPAATKVVTILAKFAGLLEKHPALAAFAGALIAVAVGFKIAATAEALFNAVTDTDPIMLAVEAVIALAAGLYELYTHSKAVRDIVADTGHFLAGAWRDSVHAAGDAVSWLTSTGKSFASAWDASVHAAGAAVNWFTSGPLAAVTHFFTGAWDQAVRAAGAVMAWFANGPIAFVKQQLAVFTQFWQEHSAEITEIAKAAWTLISAVIITAWHVALAVLGAGIAVLEALWKVGWTLISAEAKLAWALITDVVTTGWRVVLDFLRPALVILEAAWKFSWDLIRDEVRMVWDTMAAIISTSIHIILDIISIALDLLTGHWGQAWDDCKKLVSDAISGVGRILSTFASTALTLLVDAGKNIVQGLINGIGSMAGAALHAVESVGSGLLHGAESFLGIGSPSKKFYEIGAWVTKGLALGLTETAAQVQAAGIRLAGLVTSAFAGGQITGSEENSLLARITTGLASRLQSLAKLQATISYDKLGADITTRIGSGILETMPRAIRAARQLMEAIARELARGEISTSQAAQLTLKIQEALTARHDKLVKTMQEIGLKMAAGLLSSLEGADTAAKAKSAVNKMITYVQQAWAAGDITTRQASSMTRWLEVDNSRLQSLAARRQKLTATIKAADAYAATTTANVESWAGLSNVAGGMTSGGMTYSGNILAGMQADLSQIRQFGVAIKKLAKLGLRKDLLNQIIQMGPAQGLQVAEALIEGPASVIAEMDKTQAAITAGSASLGHTAADLEYDTGKAAGKGFLSGLQAQEKEVTKMMDRLAKSMVATMRRELGIGGGKETAANLTVNVHGFIGSEPQLAAEIYKLIQQESLRHSRRNGGNNGLNL